MSWSEFAFIGIACAATILICRVVPVFALRGRDAGFWPAAIPLIAAAAVIAVAIKTKSLVWCIVVGVGVFGLLLLV